MFNFVVQNQLVRCRQYTVQVIENIIYLVGKLCFICLRFGLLHWYFIYLRKYLLSKYILRYIIIRLVHIYKIAKLIVIFMILTYDFLLFGASLI